MQARRWSGKALVVGALSLGALGALDLFAVVSSRGAPSPPALGPEQVGPGNRGAVYRAEELVDVWHGGKWYAGRVHAVGNDRYFVTFDGFSKSWHEWVDASRLRQRR